MNCGLNKSNLQILEGNKRAKRAPGAVEIVAHDGVVKAAGEALGKEIIGYKIRGEVHLRWAPWERRRWDISGLSW